MAEKPKKNPERYYKREQVYFQHPAVREMPKLSDALKDKDKQGNVPLAAHEALAREAALQAGEIEGETHYGRIRRLNREWNEQHPVFREHKVELNPWEKLPYNERALHHHQFSIPNGGGAMKTTPHDQLRVQTHSYKNDDGSIGHYTKLDQVPEGWDMVEAVGKALGEHPHAIEAKLREQEQGQYPKEFGAGSIEHRRKVAKEFGLSASKIVSHENPDPWNRSRRN